MNHQQLQLAARRQAHNERNGGAPHAAIGRERSRHRPFAQYLRQTGNIGVRQNDVDVTH
jgi:hypothetical protein